MRSGKKMYVAVITAVIAAGLFTSTALAAKGNKIKTVKLEIQDKLQLGSAMDEDEELDITTNDDDYSVTEWEFNNDEGFTWDVEDVPQVKVTLETDDDSYFSVTKDKVKIKGAEATVVSTKKDGSRTLYVTLNLKPMSERVGTIEYAYLEGQTATWAPALGAQSYEIYLYRDGRTVGSKRTTTELTLDFGTAMNKVGEYSYKVRGVGGDGTKEGAFTESQSYYKNTTGQIQSSSNGTTETAQQTPGTWVQEGDGTWRFFNPDSTQPVNWMQINGKWYYFDAESRMVTGWVCWNDLWYYLGPDGAMWVNGQTPDGHTVDENGVRIQ